MGLAYMGINLIIGIFYEVIIIIKLNTYVIDMSTFDVNIYFL